MKTAVVFYTRDGSTRVAAGILAQKYGADIFELQEVRNRGRSALSFMAAGFGAVTGRKSRLKEDHTAKMGAYERICIGTPVWASNAVPAVNTFVGRLDAKNKHIIIFAVHADPNPTNKSTEKLKARLEKKGAVVEKVLCLHGAGVGKTAQESDLEKQIADLLS